MLVSIRVSAKVGTPVFHWRSSNRADAETRPVQTEPLSVRVRHRDAVHLAQRELRIGAIGEFYKPVPLTVPGVLVADYFRGRDVRRC